MDFSETIDVCDINVGRCRQLNEYKNLCEYQRSRPFIDLGPRSLKFNTRLLEPNFIWSLHGMLGMTICSNVPGHIPKMASRPACGKNLQKSLSSEPRG